MYLLFQSKVDPTQVWKLIWLFLHICYTSQQLEQLVTFPIKNGNWSRLHLFTMRMLPLPSFWLSRKVTVVILDARFTATAQTFVSLWHTWVDFVISDSSLHLAITRGEGTSYGTDSKKSFLKATWHRPVYFAAYSEMR